MKQFEPREMVFIELPWLKRFLFLARFIFVSILLLSFAFLGDFIKEEINEIECQSDV